MDPGQATRRDGLDSEGFLESCCAVERIAPVYRPVLDDSIARLTSAFEAKWHSIYLYGSVAIGHARPVQSDLDLLVLFRDSASAADQARVADLARCLSVSFRSIVRDVGIGAVSIEEALAPGSLPGLGCFLKHLCVCVAGEDIRPALPRFRPAPEVARGFNGDYAAVLGTMLSELAESSQPEAERAVMRRICRKTVRTGFSLVMPRLGRWTTDLATSCSCFGELYAQQLTSMTLILGWIETPPGSRAEFLRALLPLAEWLTAEFERVIGV